MGAQKWVDIHSHETPTKCVQALRNKGYQIIATTPHEEECLLENFDISKPSALFFGTEIDGLSKEIMEQADGFLKIQMVGSTESLNVSVLLQLLFRT